MGSTLSLLGLLGLRCLIKKTLEGERGRCCKESTPVSARERPGQRRDGAEGPGCRRPSPLPPHSRTQRCRLPPPSRPGLTDPFSPPGRYRRPRSGRAQAASSLGWCPGGSPSPSPSPPRSPEAVRAAPTNLRPRGAAGEAAGGRRQPRSLGHLQLSRDAADPSASHPAPAGAEARRDGPRRAPGTAGRGCPSAALAHLSSQAGKPPAPRSLHARWGRTDGRRLPAVPEAGDAGGRGEGRRGVARPAPPRPAPAPVPTPGRRERRGGCEAAPPRPKAAGGRGAESESPGPSSAGRRAGSAERGDGRQGLPQPSGSPAGARPALAGPRRRGGWGEWARDGGAGVAWGPAAAGASPGAMRGLAPRPPLPPHRVSALANREEEKVDLLYLKWCAPPASGTSHPGTLRWGTAIPAPLPGGDK